MSSKIIYGDCMDELDVMPEKSVNLIVTDPPYFVPTNHYNTRKQFKRNFGDLGVMEFFFKEVIKKMVRVLKDDGYLYLFCNGQSYPIFYYHLYPYFKSIRPLVWDKKTSINGYSWRHQHELIIFAEMSEAKPIPSGDGDILRYQAVKVDARKHPAEKPVDLIKKLVEKSSKEGDVVLDCFAGCGSTGQACSESKRSFIGIEKEIVYYKIMEERLALVVPTETNKQVTL